MIQVYRGLRGGGASPQQYMQCVEPLGALPVPTHTTRQLCFLFLRSLFCPFVIDLLYRFFYHFINRVNAQALNFVGRGGLMSCWHVFACYCMHVAVRFLSRVSAWCKKPRMSERGESYRCVCVVVCWCVSVWLRVFLSHGGLIALCLRRLCRRAHTKKNLSATSAFFSLLRWNDIA